MPYIIFKPLKINLQKGLYKLLFISPFFSSCPWMFSETFLTFRLTSLLCFHMFPWTHINLQAWHKDTIKNKPYDIVYLWSTVIMGSVLMIRWAEAMSQADACQISDKRLLHKMRPILEVIYRVTQKGGWDYFLIWEWDVKLKTVGFGLLPSGEKKHMLLLGFDIEEKAEPSKACGMLDKKYDMWLVNYSNVNDYCILDNHHADDILPNHQVTRRWIFRGCLFLTSALLKVLQRWLSHLPLAFPMTSRNIQVTICLLNTTLRNTQTKILPVRKGVGVSSRYRVSGSASYNFKNHPS